MHTTDSAPSRDSLLIAQQFQQWGFPEESFAWLAIDAKSAICFWHGAAEDILGYTREEAFGQNLAELIIPKEYWHYHEADMAQRNASPSVSGEIKRVESIARRKDGEQIPVALALFEIEVEGRRLFCAILSETHP